MTRTKYVVHDADGREIDIGVAATYGTGRLGRIAAEIQRVAESEYFGALRAHQERHNLTPLGRREYAQDKAAPALKKLAELRRQAISEGTAGHADAFDRMQAKLREVAPPLDSVSVHIALEHGRVLAGDFKLRSRLVDMAKNNVLDPADAGFAAAIIRLPSSLTKVSPNDRATVEKALVPGESAEFYTAVQLKSDLAAMAANAAKAIASDAGLAHQAIAAVDQGLADAVVLSNVSGDVPSALVPA